jgi:hypothetical protein
MNMDRHSPHDTVAKFLVPDWGIVVDSDIGLLYRPASQCSLEGRYDNPESTTSISQGLRIWPLYWMNPLELLLNILKNYTRNMS